MPIVTIKLIPDGITTEQKAEVIKGVTDVLFDVLGKPREVTTVIIEEIPAENIGKGGESTAAIRARNAQK